MKLCFSCAFWLVAYPNRGHEMLFDAHTCGFAALCGVSRRGIYDNTKIAVDEVFAINLGSKPRHLWSTPDLPICARIPFLMPTSAALQAAGRRESLRRTCKTVGTASALKRLQDATLGELNAWLAMRCRELWQEVRHPKQRDLRVPRYSNLNAITSCPCGRRLTAMSRRWRV